VLRWRDVSLYALIGAGVAIVVAARVEQSSARLSVNGTAPAVAMLLMVLAIVVLHHIAGVRLAHVRHAFRYPPLPIAVVLGILLVGVFDATMNKKPHWQSIAVLELLYLRLGLRTC
jgi:cytochrome bd-type quinol oxidase subunit 2